MPAASDIERWCAAGGSSLRQEHVAADTEPAQDSAPHEKPDGLSSRAGPETGKTDWKTGRAWKHGSETRQRGIGNQDSETKRENLDSETENADSETEKLGFGNWARTASETERADSETGHANSQTRPADSETSLSGGENYFSIVSR